MHESAPYPAFRVAWRADDWVPEAVGCEDERIRVFWVSYIVGTNGDLTHFDSEVGWVDAQHPSVTMVIRLPQFNGLFCDGRWYLVVGNQPVKQSVASADVGYTFRRETGPYPWTEDGQGAIGADKTPPCSLYETPAPSTAEAGAGTPGWGS